MAEKYSYWATSLIGGAEGSLDSIDGTDLNDQDMAIVAVMADKFYLYSLDADSAAAESSPDVIAPDSNAGLKRWILQSIHTKIDGIDLNGGTDIGADLADEDLILVDDGAGGTNRKATLNRLKAYMMAAGVLGLIASTPQHQAFLTIEAAGIALTPQQSTSITWS